MKVVVTHAYSATDSGDGLLVREALALVHDTFANAVVTLLALDPKSFHDVLVDDVIHPLSGKAIGSARYSYLVHAFRSVASGFSLDGAAKQQLADADLIIAVGGGYLRFGTLVEASKTTIAHLPQLPRRAVKAPVVYLPQSIGPLRGVSGPIVRRRLRGASAVFVRDDRSGSDLAALTNVERLPDMALLGLPSALATNGASEARSNSGSVAMVGRDLGSGRRGRQYDDRVRRLQRTLSAEPVVQASSRGNNDVAYYNRVFGAQKRRSLKALVNSEERPAVVISVRLHGALEGIRAGVPSIHLSYERKGWGAYEDLGLQRFVYNAYDFDPDVVIRAAVALASDSGDYWEAVRRAVPYLENRREYLVKKLRRTIDKDVRSATT